MTETKTPFMLALEKAETSQEIRAAIMLLPSGDEPLINNGLPSIEVVEKWLEEHVQVFPEPKVIRLTNFRQIIDGRKWGGEFTLTLDSITLLKKISIENWPYNSTLIKMYLPMFCSPLGVPASYPAIDIPQKVISLIEARLRIDYKAGTINDDYSVLIDV